MISMKKNVQSRKSESQEAIRTSFLCCYGRVSIFILGPDRYVLM